MTAKLNLNGDTRDTLVDQHRGVMDACRTLIEKLRLAMPHGRNYQTHPNPIAYDNDVALNRFDQRNVQQIFDYALKSAIELEVVK